MQIAGVGEHADFIRIEARHHVDILRLNGLSVAVIGGLIQQLAVTEPVHDKYHL